MILYSLSFTSFPRSGSAEFREGDKKKKGTKPVTPVALGLSPQFVEVKNIIICFRLVVKMVLKDVVLKDS